LKKAEAHVVECKAKYDQLPEGFDFVVCKICGWHAKKLAGHLRKEHGIDPLEYDGHVLCVTSKKKYEAVAQDNGNWIEKAKARGEDLTEYKKKMGDAVRDSIMSNPENRKRRAKVMSDVNKSDVMRKKASETAKKTSARKDVQEKRAAQLKKWRDENPDDFYDKCISKMLTIYSSKPEKLLYNLVKDHPKYNLKRHRKIRSDKFKAYKQRDVDIGDADKRIYIEYDGPLHFKQTSMNQLEGVQERDRLLDEHIIKHGWFLIRVSYDQFSYRKSDYGFKNECLEKVFGILDDPLPGVHKIGAAYG
jgi:hypothetical protein